MDRTRWMDAREVRLLRATTENAALHDQAAGRRGGPLRWLVVDLALSTGLRVGELAALTRSDIDLKRCSLRVTRLKRRKDCVETLALPTGLVAHIKAYMAAQSILEPSSPILAGPRGRLSRQGIQRAWRRAIELAGLPAELSIHCARHTMAVHLLAKTRNLRQVQKQLGHASPTTTANMYADVPWQDMAEGVEGLYDDKQD